MSAFLTPLLFAAAFTVVSGVLFQARREFDRKWMEENAGMTSPLLAMEVMSDFENGGEKYRSELARYLARNYGARVVGDSFWKSPDTELLSSLDLLTRHAVEYYVAADLDNVAREPVPSAREIERSAKVDDLLHRQALRRNPWFWTFSYVVIGTAAMCVIGIVAALVFRTQPMLRMFGFAVVRSDGVLAERWRTTARAALAAIPAVGACVFLLRLDVWFWDPTARFPILGFGVLAAICLIWLAGLVANRGPAEKLTGSWIVPR